MWGLSGVTDCRGVVFMWVIRCVILLLWLVGVSRVGDGGVLL